MRQTDESQPAVVGKDALVHVAKVEAPDVYVLVLGPGDDQRAVTGHVEAQHRQLVAVQGEY